jgi:hypothetical protein
MAKIAANKPRKGAAAVRIAVSWGKYQIKIGGVMKTVEGVSRIQQGLYTKLGLQAAKVTATVKVGRDKKGRKRLEAPSTAIGSKYIEVCLGEWTETKVKGKTVKRDVWYRVRVPAYVSVANAFAQLRKGGKVQKMRWPNGRVYDFAQSDP